MSAPISPALRAFLADWLRKTQRPKWRAWFSIYNSERHLGLCMICPRNCSLELRVLLLNEFGTANYPFGKSNYYDRLNNSTQHEDPARLAWVRGKLAEPVA